MVILDNNSRAMLVFRYTQPRNPYMDFGVYFLQVRINVFTTILKSERRK